MINKPKGTHDVLPSEIQKWQHIEDTFRDTARVFGFSEIRTPIFEATELFLRSAGEGSDIVNKEMYTFIDKGNRSMTLKPEGTAGVARAFIENGMANEQQPTKLWYNTPVFRYERPQAGRFRQHHQLGAELFGSPLPEADAEVIALAHSFLTRLGVNGIKLFINSIGCKACRAEYLNALKEYYQGHAEKLCTQCKVRLSANTLRVLDCKEDGCKIVSQDAPIITQFLCGGCKSHFETLQNLLKSMRIVHEVDPKIVRGLDYYSGTVFEFVAEDIGAKSTVCGGGRYNGLVSELGGKDTPSAGFGLGIERLLLLLEGQNELQAKCGTQVYFATMGSEAREVATSFAQLLRQEGVSVQFDLVDRSLKNQLKYADNLNAEITVIIGEEELATKTATVKNMHSKSQETVQFSDLIDFIKQNLS